MQKQKCPNCGESFDYEYHGWLCPFCGMTIVGDAPPEQPQQELPTTSDYERVKKRTEPKSYVPHVVITALICVAAVVLMYVLLFVREKPSDQGTYPGTMPFTMPTIAVPSLHVSSTTRTQTETKTETTTTKAPVSIAEEQALPGETLVMDGYRLTVSDAVCPAWTAELPQLEGWHYVVVSYEKRDENGVELYAFPGQKAVPRLFDLTNHAYLKPMVQGDFPELSETEIDLYGQEGVTEDFFLARGMFLFLVKDSATQLELCIYEGDAEDFFSIRMSVKRCVTLPLTEVKPAS